MNAEYRTHLFTYRHDGAEWILAIKATDADDARARIGKLAYATYNGVAVGHTQVALAPIGIVSVWVSNTAAYFLPRFFAR